MVFYRGEVGILYRYLRKNLPISGYFQNVFTNGLRRVGRYLGITLRFQYYYY